MSSNGAPCNLCGQWVMPNSPHFCQWQIPVSPGVPAQQPPPPMYPPGGMGPIIWQPAALTLEDIRRVVREELESFAKRQIEAERSADPTSDKP